jgi:uncharacterized membrane protein YphA (DoxX/SURF4 family)
MAIDRHGAGLVALRILIGVFFLFEGIGKLHWFASSSMLAGQLNAWLRALPPASISARYLTRFIIPYTAVFARLVPIGELSSGLAMLFGFWTSLFAFIAFCMVLSFHFASGAIFTYSFLTNGYGLPVLGATLALALGGVRLPWSIRP